MSPVVAIRICRFVHSVSFHRFVGADAYIGPPRRRARTIPSYNLKRAARRQPSACRKSLFAPLTKLLKL